MIAVDVTVNGRRYREEVEPRLLLSDFLRHRLGLTGTHVGCEHGVCGACTVRLDGAAVRSCLLLAAQVDDSEIVTVEGLAGGAAAPVADDSGPPELRRLSVSFDRMAETVTGALAAQRAFVADASHQLRNPLTALRLRLSNLQGHVDPPATDDHVAALEEAERLSTLLDGLLALARTERAAPLADVDVDAAVGDRVEAWRPLAEHTGLRLHREGARGLAVAAPVGAVETVLDAVLDNAVKFSAAGGSVTVHTAAHDGSVEISVRDTGPGIPADELDRATDRFWRSPAQSNVEGSGLGLAIASRTLELAGGTLCLERPDGGGLRVVARLPASAGDGADGAGTGPPA